MKLLTRSFYLFLLFFGSLAFADEPSALYYRISLLKEHEKPMLEIQLSFYGNESGITEILLPSSWAGQEELYAEISQLVCLSSHATLEATDEPHVKRIRHLPQEQIQLRYCVATSQEPPEREWFYRPLVQESYFFFFGHGFFAVPDSSPQEKRPIVLEWEGFDQTWNLANSFAAQGSRQELYIALETLLHAVYLGGDFQILTCGKADAPVFIALRGEWSFSHAALKELVQRVIQSQRAFWNDFTFPYYLIAMLPIGKDPHGGGTGLTNAFCLFSGDLYEDNPQDYNFLAWILSHEHFHTWNGIKMRYAPPEGPLFWFTEGFTEYYAIKLNLAEGIMTLEAIVSHVNRILQDYYTSPVHCEGNARIAQDFWNLMEVQRLPYVRGFLFALRWDKKIQLLSQGRHSLDDMMHALFQHTQENRQPFSQEDIIEMASRFMPLEEAREDVERHITKGETLTVQNGDFCQKLHVEWVKGIPQYRLQEVNSAL